MVDKESDRKEICFEGVESLAGTEVRRNDTIIRDGERERVVNVIPKGGTFYTHRKEKSGIGLYKYRVSGDVSKHANPKLVSMIGTHHPLHPALSRLLNESTVVA